MPLLPDEELLAAKTRAPLTFRQVVSAGGRATLGVLVGLQLLDSVDNVLLVVFAPEIRDSLGISTGAVAVIGALAGLMVAVAALPLGLLGDRHRRTTVAGVCTLVWAAAAALLGLVQHVWQAVAIRVLAGIGKANEGPVQSALLVDAYPPAGHGRVLGLHRAGQPLGIVTGPLLAAAFAALVPEEHEPWRWAFAFLAVPALLLGVAALRLPEPARARSVPSPRGALASLVKIRTVVLVVIALSAFGVCVTTVPTFLSAVLGDDLGQGAAARGVITSVCAVGGLAGAALGGALSDRLFRRSPRACVHLAAVALPLLGIGFAVQAHAPDVATYVVVGTVTQGMTFAAIIPLSLVVAAVTPEHVRATAFGLTGVFVALVGGLGGALVTEVAESLWGQRTAIAVVAPVSAVLAGIVLVFAARHVVRDFARAGDLR
ncbi:Sugar phosphate permease [Lentzea xinjiangensis]|uniref:Sugar phosphate permease n=1 Tax=Lentzea xinjiangensis TaxID=402600 RepID=A0A1H9VV87_9PSEU|nr:MFS transporter [Lentzea xinjiangensis]SES25676.1 Sugar phosphate permease [Lentzea xinjiangensis]